MKNLFSLLAAIFSCTLTLTAVGREPAGALPLPPPPERPEFKTPDGPPSQFGREKKHQGRGFWRAFSQLSEEEQKKLLELQRNDPEQFRAVMQKKVEEMLKREHKERQEIRNLSESYRRAETADEKKLLKEKLRTIIAAQFKRMLAEHRRNLEQNRKRLQRLEEDLKQREEKQQAIVETMLEHMLTAMPSGELLPPPAGHYPPPEKRQAPPDRK